MAKDRTAQRTKLLASREALLRQLRALDAKDREDERRALNRQRATVGKEALDAGLGSLETDVRVQAFAALMTLAQDVQAFEEWLMLWGSKTAAMTPTTEASDISDVSWKAR